MRSGSFKYLYGPVPSRRLGRSLGIDLVPFKTCTYDCIYCQLGRTTNKTIERRQYAPIKDILHELHVKLADGPPPDYISIAGSGEPTLNSYIGELIGLIKNMTSIPVAVLTNGSLLYLPDVRASLMRADLVIPSLDAGDETIFRYVNRPHHHISFENMVKGLMEFTHGFPGRVWLEVLLVSGVTGMAADVKKIASWAKTIEAEKIQLNTVCRPASEEYACAVAPGQMEDLAGLFPGFVDVLSDENPLHLSTPTLQEAAGGDIISLLARRPCTLSDICAGLGLHPQDAVKKIKILVGEKRISTLRADRDVIYIIAEHQS